MGALNYTNSHAVVPHKTLSGPGLSVGSRTEFPDYTAKYFKPRNPEHCGERSKYAYRVEGAIPEVMAELDRLMSEWLEAARMDHKGKIQTMREEGLIPEWRLRRAMGAPPQRPNHETYILLRQEAADLVAVRRGLKSSLLRKIVSFTHEE